MILTCPSCRTRYRTDSGHFKPPGRDVRCAKCGEVWFQRSSELGAQGDQEPVRETLVNSGGQDLRAPPEPSSGFGIRPMREAPERDVRPRGTALAKFVASGALIVLVATIAWAIVQYRQTIVGLWPQSASLYDVLGLPVNVSGIEITEIAYRRDMQNGVAVLSVTGKLVNVSNRELPIPQIRVVLLDDAKRELYQWTFDAGIPSLKPGAESPFVTRLSSPPPAARNLHVRFAEKQ